MKLISQERFIIIVLAIVLIVLFLLIPHAGNETIDILKKPTESFWNSGFLNSEDLPTFRL